MTSTHQLQSLSDDELLRSLSEIMQQSRRLDADLIAHIGEVDERRLYAREACSSMFTYCTEVLQLSEPEAYLRIAVARAARSYPMLLPMLADGRLHLSAIALLAPHLTTDNCVGVLARATHRSKNQIKELLAELAPKPDVPAVIRKLPTPPQPSLQLRPDGVEASSRLVSPAAPPPAPAKTEPLAPGRYKVQFTASSELRDKLEQLQALMETDLAAVIEAAVTEKLDRLEARRYAKTKAPRKTLEETDTSPRSRYIPAAVRRAVHERDGDQCGFVDKNGRRCSECRGLEFHHHDPFGRGGAHDADTISLRCRTHNAYLAEQEYGKHVMDRYRRPVDRVSEPAPWYDACYTFR
jgi:hypothetical protein